jgi:hypothetical protein
MFPSEFPQRPKYHDEDVLKCAAELLTEEVVGWSNGQEPHEQVLADLIEALSFGKTDGYELANKLQRKGWTPDAQLVEILDTADYRRSQAHKEAVMAWVKAHDLKLQLQMGAVVSIEHDGKMYQGEIVNLNHEVAQYTVFVKELGHVRSGMGIHGLIFGFEDVVAS